MALAGGGAGDFAAADGGKTKKGGEGKCHLEDVGLDLAEAGVEASAEVGLLGEEVTAWVLAEAGLAVGTEFPMEHMLCRSPVVVTHTMDMAYRSLTAVTRGKG